MKKLILTLVTAFACQFLPFANCAAETIRIGVMLPFKTSSAVSPQAVDYYRGLLLAVDSLRKTGTNFRIYTYNTAETAMSTILRDSIIPHLNIIFGPDDALQFKQLNDFVAQNQTKLVNAFCPTSSTVNTNPNVFVLYPSASVMAEDATQLCASTFDKPNLVVVDTRKMAQPIVGKLKENVKKTRFLQLGFSQDELKSRLSKNKINIVLPSSNDMESAQAVIDQLEIFLKVNPQYQVKLLGYPDWLPSVEALENKLHVVDTYIFSPYFDNNASARNQTFRRSYQQAFHKSMLKSSPRMACYGFDSGYFLLKGLAKYGRLFGEQPVYSAPLQNGFLFRRTGNSAGLVNHKMQFIHYRRDGGVELIEKK